MTKPTIVPAKHITPEEAKRVSIFACDVAEALGLPRYQFVVMVKPSEKSALASISTPQHRHIAEISVNKDWLNRTDDERMNCIVHEVLHLIHRDVDHAVKQSMRYMHSHEFDAVWEGYRREAELMVDYLAMFVSDFTTIKAGWESSLKTARKEL